MPIIVNEGDKLEISVNNNTNTKTNIHWHGMSVENDQDGPGIMIEPGKTHKYDFIADESGTYWYHSHERPVRDQVDKGMYAPLIVKAETDKLYSKDYILMLDDWVVPGVKDNSASRMHMEIMGNVDTVNGKTADTILPISIKTNEIQKLRFIGSSTALTHDISFPTEVRVTHTDGRALEVPYFTTSLLIAPGERYDVELEIDLDEDNISYITNGRGNGLDIPVHYSYNPTVEKIESPFVPMEGTNIIGDFKNKDADFTMVMSSGGMSSNSNTGMMSWTINGEVFPNLEAFHMDLNRTYVVRFKSDLGMHSMDHPMHIHGAHFTVLNTNGLSATSEVSKDTISVPAGGYVDIAIKFDKVGEWMVHCHILDHEDGGMMTTIVVK